MRWVSAEGQLLRCPSALRAATSREDPGTEEVFCLEAPFGRIHLFWKQGLLKSIELEPGSGPQKSNPRSFPQGLDPRLESIVEWVMAYLQEPTTPAPLSWTGFGTPYQQRVYTALQAIPVGSVVTYGALARQLETGPRALAGALRANRLPLLIPCHRVIAAQGIGGFCGQAQGDRVGIKRWLLAHEGALSDF